MLPQRSRPELCPHFFSCGCDRIATKCSQHYDTVLQGTLNRRCSPTANNQRRNGERVYQAKFHQPTPAHGNGLPSNFQRPRDTALWHRASQGMGNGAKLWACRRRALQLYNYSDIILLLHCLLYGFTLVLCDLHCYIYIYSMTQYCTADMPQCCWSIVCSGALAIVSGTYITMCMESQWHNVLRT